MRDKLIELLKSATTRAYWNAGDTPFMSKIADHLIANGVVVREKGEWVVCGDGDNVPWMCSHCGKTTAHKYKVMYGNFCPNCGADMRKEKPEA